MTDPAMLKRQGYNRHTWKWHLAGAKTSPKTQPLEVIRLPLNARFQRRSRTTKLTLEAFNTNLDSRPCRGRSEPILFTQRYTKEVQ